MRRIRSVMAIVIFAVTIFPASGCSYMSDSKRQLLDVSDHYAKALASCDLVEIGSCCDDDFAAAEEAWDEKLDFVAGSYYSGAYAANAAGKIAEAITYEVETNSVSERSGHGSVVCEFTVPDYLSSLDPDAHMTMDSYFESVFANEKQVLVLTLEFEQKDGAWVAVNYQDTMSALYEFTSAEFSFITPFTSNVLGGIWYGSYDDNGGYINTYALDLDIQLEYATDYSTIYYTVVYEGSEIKREYGEYEGYLFYDDDGAPLDPSGEYLAAGDYTITFYDQYGQELLSGTAHVLVDSETNGLMYNYQGYDWYDFSDDGYDIMESGYYQNTTTIDLDVYFSSEDIYSIYYTYEYEGEEIKREYGTTEGYLFASDEGAPLDPSGNYLAAGEYTITFYYPDGTIITQQTAIVDVY